MHRAPVIAGMLRGPLLAESLLGRGGGVFLGSVQREVQKGFRVGGFGVSGIGGARWAGFGGFWFRAWES